MSKKNEFTTTIESLGHEGRGVAHINGKATFILNALPQETVLMHYTRRWKSHDEGKATQILKPSTQRVAAKCPHYGVCGGCSLQHLEHSQQVLHKQTTVLELLKHHAKIQPEILLPPLTAMPWGYRHKARLSVKHVLKKGKVLIGFHEQDKRFIADLSQCEVLHPHVGRRIALLSEFIMQLEGRDIIPQIEITITETQTALILRHLKPLSNHDLDLCETFAKQENFYLYLQPQGLNSIYLLYPKNISPLLSYTLPDYHLELFFRPEQFIQINPHINRLMIKQALTLLDLKTSDTVLDLFCGIGNFTLPMAQLAKEVTGVEADSSAITAAKNNAQHNKLQNTQFQVADLHKTIFSQDWQQRRYDKVLLDPPRTGAQEILTQIPIWQPERIVYVSCNPATLARDANGIQSHGYLLKAAGILDMFPHTKHTEVMCLFTRIED